MSMMSGGKPWAMAVKAVIADDFAWVPPDELTAWEVIAPMKPVIEIANARL